MQSTLVHALDKVDESIERLALRCAQATIDDLLVIICNIENTLHHSSMNAIFPSVVPNDEKKKK